LFDGRKHNDDFALDSGGPYKKHKGKNSTKKKKNEFEGGKKR